MFSTKTILIIVMLAISLAIPTARLRSVTGIIGSLNRQTSAVVKDSSSDAGSLPNVQGEEAVEYLKDQGLYSSLGEAVKEARYGVYESHHSLQARADEQFYADNPSQQYQAYFSPEKVRISAGEGEQQRLDLVMKLRGLGYGDRLLAVTPGRLKASNNRVEIARSVTSDGSLTGSGQAPVGDHKPSEPEPDSESSAADFQSEARNPQSAVSIPRSAVVEWYINRKEGLEQGFTIERTPGKARADERLRLKLDISGQLRAEVDSQGKTLWLKDEQGRAVMSYSKLTAYDAQGQELESQMKVDGRAVWLEVDDHGAEYPVTIDPIFSEQQKLTAGDAAANDQFGFSVAIDGDTAVIGSPLEENGTGVILNFGAVYVFVRTGSTWTQQQKLRASDAVVSADFGTSVAISGETIVVGAPRDDNAGGQNAGAAYVFVRTGTTWTEQQKLRASDAAALDEFAISVAIDGETAIVGANLDDNAGGGNAGAAYVFVRTETMWAEQQKLTAGDTADSDLFGISVAIDGETAIVGAQSDDNAGGTNAGAAYVFVRTETMWAEQQKLTASDAADNDQLGISVAIDQETAVVGAQSDDNTGGTNAGAAYVFVRSSSTWTEQQKLTASDAAGSDTFGRSVAIDAETVVVGANQDDNAGGTNAGAAYVFSRTGTTWAEQQKLTPSDAAANDQFGHSVAIDGETIVAGAPFNNNAGGSDAGAAYVFTVVPCSTITCPGSVKHFV